MTAQNNSIWNWALALLCGLAFSASGQSTNSPAPGASDAPPFAGSPDFDGPHPFGPGGFGPGGPAGPGGRMQPGAQLVKQFDRDGDQRLNAAERKAAREFLTQQGSRMGRRGSGDRPGFGPRNERQKPAQPGAPLAPADVKSGAGAPLYDAKTLRTLFLEFENADWEKELADFKNTDVEVPATVTVDGKIFPDVGVHFHGASSFMMVGEGQKRSLVLTFDFAHDNQQLEGYHKLNLLNSHEDATFLRTVLSLQIARAYIPAPRANFMRVVINGESWGIYVNQQHFSKEFLKESFGTSKGARWKVPGSPNGRGSLAYLGEDAAAYQRIYEIKSKDDPGAWKDLIQLCKVLNQTPPNQLVAALSPLLDIEGTLKYLAWDNALVNGDGYWTRTSDYDIYEDPQGRFHMVPYDANETFSSGGGPGGPRGPGGPGFGGPPGVPTGAEGNAARGQVAGGTENRTNFLERGFAGPGGRGPGGRRGGAGGGGVELDPLAVANDANKPLVSKLLAVPELRARYLAYVRDIAEKWLDWNKLGPLAEQYQALIAGEVKADTRKLDSTEEFFTGLTNTVSTTTQGFRGPPSISLKRFAEQRRAFLLSYKPVATTTPTTQ